MKVKVFTLKYESATGRIDDAILTDFVKDREVISVKDHFFIKEECPHLAMVVTYMQNPVSEEVRGEKKPPAGDRNKWREILSEEDLPLFNTIRDWRTERAKKEGVPPYVICNNTELAHMVKKRPDSLNKLLEIEGFGRAKAEKYGRELLELLSKRSIENEARE